MADDYNQGGFDPRKTQRRVWTPGENTAYNNSGAWNANTNPIGQQYNQPAETQPLQFDNPATPHHTYVEADKKSGKLWLWIILAVIVLGGSAAAWYFLMRDDASVNTVLIDDVEEEEDDIVATEPEEAIDASEFGYADSAVVETPAPAPTATPAPAAPARPARRDPLPAARPRTVAAEPAAPATPVAPATAPAPRRQQREEVEEPAASPRTRQRPDPSTPHRQQRD